MGVWRWCAQRRAPRLPSAPRVGRGSVGGWEVGREARRLGASSQLSTRLLLALQAATVGLLVHINGVHFPGMLSPTYGVSFESLSQMGPFEAWQAIPLLGQAQILWTIAGLEHASECLDPAGHYTKGGEPGNLKFLKRFWDTPGFTKNLTAEQLAEKRLSELKNGRLAMIGMASISFSMAIPSSVPLLTGAGALWAKG